MTANTAYVISNDPLLRLPAGALEVEYGSVESQPRRTTDIGVIIAQFGGSPCLTCSQEQFEQDIAGPLRFCFLAAQAALSWHYRPRRMVLVAAGPFGQAGGIANVGSAMLSCVVRSLAIEAAPSGLTTHGIAVASVDERIERFLTIEPPAGSWFDLRLPQEAPPCGGHVPSHSARGQRVAVITGAAQGLGRAIAEKMTELGHAVLLVDANQEGVRAASQQLACCGRRVASFAADVSQREQVRAAAEFVLAEFGCMDVWVNNAGISTRGEIKQLGIGDWDRVINTNLGGTLWGVQAAYEAMRERGGVILNIGSTAARSAGLAYAGHYNAYAPYAASKAGIASLTRVLAHVVGSAVRINAIAPGPILTEMTRHIYTREQLDQLQQHIPVQRIGEPQDIAAAAGFLVSEQAGFISGEVLTVDGGLSALAAGVGCA